MSFLVDTHLLLWSAVDPRRVPTAARKVLEDPASQLFFSAVSFWEIEIKRALGRADFRPDPRALRRGLVENGYRELALTSEHTLGIELLPPIHKDLFDRILIAQATSEGFLLLTSDEDVARYPGPILKV